MPQVELTHIREDLVFHTAQRMAKKQYGLSGK